MFYGVLNTPLDDTSRLDGSRKCLLLWKPSDFIVLTIIWHQSKTKTISTSLNNNSRYKTRKVSRCGFFELEMLEIFTRAFLLKIMELELYAAFSLKKKKKITKKMRVSSKIIKIFHMASNTRKSLKRRRKWKTKSIRRV